jgi:type VII secretion integral membrane protein EccD
VRVTVATGPRRADLAVPSEVPIAEVLPTITQRCGIDLRALAAGPRLARLTGELLDPSVPLAALGVVDGDVLVLESATAPSPVFVHDDLAEAVAEAAADVRWRRTAREGSVAAAAVLPMLLGGAAVLVARSGLGSVGTAVLTTGALLTGFGAAAAARLHRCAAATALAVTAVMYAVCAAIAVTASTPPLLSGSAAGAAAAVAAAFAVPACRVVFGMWSTGAVGLVLTAGLAALTGWPLVPVLAGLLAGVLLLAPAAPRLAGALSGLSAQAAADAWQTQAPGRGSRRELRDRVRRAHDVLLGSQAALSTVVLVAIPAVSSSGTPGVALATLAGLALVLRSRRAVTRAAATIALASGILGVMLTGLMAAVRSPTEAASVLAIAGLGACTRAVHESVSPRLVRTYDLLDTAVQLGALPLAVLVII